MTTIQNAVCASGVSSPWPAPGGSATTPPASIGTADLLPTCAAPDRAQLGDAMTTLYALQLEAQNSGQTSGQAQVESGQQLAHDALQQQLQALQRQQHDTGGRGFFSCVGQLLKDITVDVTEFDFKKLVTDVRSDGAACDNPQFWSDLELGAKIVAAIAAAAATVVSCGTLGPVVVGVAIALSAAGFVVQQTHCLGSASAWVGLGCQLAASVLTCGASLSASAATTSTTLLQTAGNTASAASGAATVVAGTAHAEVTGYQADALQAQADGVQAQNDGQFAQQMEQWAIDSLQEQDDSHRDAMSTLSGAIHTNEQASLIAAAPMARG
jgi:hypothetical protein